MTLRANLIPGAAAAVRELKRLGYRLALVADGPATTFPTLPSMVVRLLRHFAISEQSGCRRTAHFHHPGSTRHCPADYGRVVMSQPRAT